MHRNLHYSKEDILAQLDLYKPFLDLFDGSIFLTVSEWDGKDFYSHINNTIEKVIKHLESKIQDSKYCYISIGLIPHIIKYYKKFPEIIKLGLEGKRSLAYEKLSEGILPEATFAFATFRDLTHHHLMKSDSNSVYRMRVNDNIYNSDFSSKDLFHIPFEKRHLIGNNRFSLSGLPCLYFGNSINCCWEEMNRPNLENCFVSKFNLTGHHFIDLTRTPDEITKNNNDFFEKLKLKEESNEHTVKSIEYIINDYLCIWPLIFCCSVRTYYHNSVFKPEYIFPQLLLEWIISDYKANFDGIKFLSTKKTLLNSKFKNENFRQKNIVIPVRVLNTSGFCKESLKKIALTEPINLQIESLLKNKILNDTEKDIYKNSVFGKLEKILDTKEMSFCT